MLHPCSSNHDLLGGLPAGRRWQVGLVVVGRWPVPPRAAAWQHKHTDHLAARFRPDFSRGALWEPNPAVAGQGNGEAARQRDRQA